MTKIYKIGRSGLPTICDFRGYWDVISCWATAIPPLFSWLPTLLLLTRTSWIGRFPSLWACDVHRLSQSMKHVRRSPFYLHSPAFHLSEFWWRVSSSCVWSVKDISSILRSSSPPTLFPLCWRPDATWNSWRSLSLPHRYAAGCWEYWYRGCQLIKLSIICTRTLSWKNAEQWLLDLLEVVRLQTCHGAAAFIETVM